ncbi:MAG: leucine-rich repeat domain-containing protein [Holosporales bacterium]|jgi:uncharacterized ParB-like nuclease family protein|nr:leucine-rich repeat domain-containing protein [Holosporales bacterium]
MEYHYVRNLHDVQILIPRSVRRIPERAFCVYRWLQCVIFEPCSSVVHIEGYAFRDCDLCAVCIPNSVRTLEDHVFWRCSNLQSVTFEPQSQVSCIEQYTFADCSRLQAIDIPDSVIAVKEYAFDNCTSLKYVTIASRPTMKQAFTKCSPQLRIFYLPAVRQHS